jgi:signal transduction histidine kinase
MPEQPGQKLWSPIDRRLVTSLIDKIVAVQLDLKPLCNCASPPADPERVETTIAAACDILESAIEDLRNIIQRLEDLPSG